MRLSATPVCEKLIHRQSMFACVALAIAAAQAGCNGRAHSDVYRQRMASEIRVLEDQLYEADYENRVLRDKLAHEKSRQVVVQAAPAQSTPSSARPVAPAGSDSAGSDSSGTRQQSETPNTDRPQRAPRNSDDAGGDEMDLGSGLEDDDLSLPTFDEGEPVDPNALTDPSGLLPAPGGPEPPGRRDTELPDVEPGDPAPPPVSADDEVKPPGRIDLPPNLSGGGVPAKIRIHTTLSGGHPVDGKMEEVTIVVNAIDKFGKTVDLSTFDVDADLSVVVLDPDKEPSEARLGRWDFARSKVASLVRENPISGLHIPLAWSDVQPSGDDVIVHVRLRAEDDEMRCQGRIRVQQTPAITEWTPRGDKLR